MRSRFTAGFLAVMFGTSLVILGAGAAQASRHRDDGDRDDYAYQRHNHGWWHQRHRDGAGGSYYGRRSSNQGSNWNRGSGSQFVFPGQSPNSGSYSNGGYQYQNGGSTGKGVGVPSQNGGYQYQNGGYSGTGQYGSGGNLPGFSRRHHRHRD